MAGGQVKPLHEPQTGLSPFLGPSRVLVSSLLCGGTERSCVLVCNTLCRQCGPDWTLETSTSPKSHPSVPGRHLASGTTR